MTTNMNRLLEIMARLRDPSSGCPWDIEQNFATIAPHTIEEAYEVAEAIAHNDMAALEDELGDLLLQVVFHAQMADEAGHFDFEAVAGTICEKLVRRHPHVFGDDRIVGSAAQTRAWEEHKAIERKTKGEGLEGTLDGVTLALPALTRASKLQKRAARVGFDWNHADQILDKIAEEMDEISEEMAAGADRDRLEDEMGDLLFACANLARKLGLDPETALRRGNSKFETRFRRVEALLAEDGKTPDSSTLDEMEARWTRVKRED
jgi:ATP diphosphatase